MVLLSSSPLCDVIHSSARNSWKDFFRLIFLISKQYGSNTTHCCVPMAGLAEAGALLTRKGKLVNPVHLNEEQYQGL